MRATSKRVVDHNKAWEKKTDSRPLSRASLSRKSITSRVGKLFLAQKRRATNEKENQVTARLPRVEMLSPDLESSVTTASLSHISPYDISKLERSSLNRSRESNLLGAHDPNRPLLSRPPNFFHIKDLTNLGGQSIESIAKSSLSRNPKSRTLRSSLLSEKLDSMTITGQFKQETIGLERSLSSIEATSESIGVFSKFKQFFEENNCPK